MKLLIVNFHYFREETYPSGIYPLSRAALEKQTDELAKYCEFISQEELIGFIEEKNYEDKNYCLLTIDDGLKEQMDAFHFLRKKGIPSILYVPTAPLQNNRVLDVHKIHYVRTKMTDDEMYGLLDEKYRISETKFDMATLANQYRYDNDTARKVKYFLNFELNEHHRGVATDLFFSELVDDEEEFARNLYMSEGDVRELAGYAALGSHGYNHIPLATKPFEVAREDIHKSLDHLDRITGYNLFSFSYPFGGKDAVNSSLAPAFEGTGVKFAHTMWRGINTEENLNNPLFLNRIDTNDAPGGKNNSLNLSPLDKSLNILVAETLNFSPKAVEGLKQLGSVTLRDIEKEELTHSLATYDVFWFRLKFRIEETDFPTETKTRFISLSCYRA